jgi:hypothetical protein
MKAVGGFKTFQSDSGASPKGSMSPQSAHPIAVSQWEREAIGERTKDALSHKRRKGNGWATLWPLCKLRSHEEQV